MDHASLIAKAPPHSPAYLVLQVQPEGVGGDRYRLTSWHQLGVTEEWQPKRGLDRTGALADIKEAVAELMEGIEQDWAPQEPTIYVEFVLPEELLNLDVDQWAWDTDYRMPEPIGCHFHVVIRSLERMTTQKWHRPWYRRWRQLQDQLVTYGAIARDSGYWSMSADDASTRRIMSDFERGPRWSLSCPARHRSPARLGPRRLRRAFAKGFRS